MSVSLGKLPRIGKTAKIDPILKSSKACSPSDYQPISLLPVASKAHTLYPSDPLDTYAPISNLQWGFQRRKSTVNALLSVTHEWFSKQLDERCEVFCVLQKAFDILPHKQLMLQLKNFVHSL